MSGVYSEAEQLEDLKKWWHEYGTSIIVGIVLAVILGFGWRFWQQYREHKLENASVSYEQLLTNAVNGNSSVVESEATDLIAQYPRTPYAQLAALQLARQKIYQGDLTGAKDELEWVLEHGKNRSLRQVARLRMARVLLAMNQPEDALKTIHAVDDIAYLPAIDEVEGDVYVALNKPQQAYDAYTAAIKTFPGFVALRPLLQMKIDALAGSVNVGSQ